MAQRNAMERGLRMPEISVTIEQTADGDVFVFDSYGTRYRYREDVLEQVEDGDLPLEAIAPDVWRYLLNVFRENWEAF
jgi:hypothetical protein